MSLTLTIENMPSLPDGGPLSFRLAGARGADIGRDSHLDWSLPDTTRFISGKHCEIRFREGSYWLSDVSTNGTFINQSDRRMQSPHRLKTGDRLLIGQYIVAVDVQGGDAMAAPPSMPYLPDANEPEDLWGSVEGAALPVDPRDFRPPSQNRPVKPDFLEWAVDVPNSPGVGFGARPVAPSPAAPSVAAPEPLDWAAGGMPAPPPPEPAPQVPTPRRSVWINPGPAGPWDAGQAASQPEQRPQPEPPSGTNPSLRPEHLLPPPPAAYEMPRQVATAAPEARPAAAPDVLRSFARGAGLPPEALAGRDANAFAEHLGQLMRIVADNLKQLLAARSQTKRIARTANQTMIQALNNNPLKFSPSAAEALRVMFGPQTGSYLDADKALQQSFEDLKAHQIKTFSAMQQALQMLVEDLDPKELEAGLGKEQGIAAVLGSRKARLWDLYQSRWAAKSKGRDGGLLELYLSYFAEAYDREPSHGPN